MSPRNGYLFVTMNDYIVGKFVQDIEMFLGKAPHGCSVVYIHNPDGSYVQLRR